MNDIRWLDEALQDLDDIGSYIAMDNERAAAAVVRRIVGGCRSLVASEARPGAGR